MCVCVCERVHSRFCNNLFFVSFNVFFFICGVVVDRVRRLGRTGISVCGSCSVALRRRACASPRRRRRVWRCGSDKYLPIPCIVFSRPVFTKNSFGRQRGERILKYIYVEIDWLYVYIFVATKQREQMWKTRTERTEKWREKINRKYSIMCVCAAKRDGHAGGGREWTKRNNNRQRKEKNESFLWRTEARQRFRRVIFWTSKNDKFRYF